METRVFILDRSGTRKRCITMDLYLGSITWHVFIIYKRNIIFSSRNQPPEVTIVLLRCLDLGMITALERIDHSGAISPTTTYTTGNWPRFSKSRVCTHYTLNTIRIVYEIIDHLFFFFFAPDRSYYYIDFEFLISSNDYGVYNI